MAQQPVTFAQLQEAWRHCRRPGWPDTVEATLADPLLGRLVRMHAVVAAQRLKRRLRMPRTPQRPAGQPRPPIHKPFDPKRLAAGDTDDDD